MLHGQATARQLGLGSMMVSEAEARFLATFNKNQARDDRVND